MQTQSAEPTISELIQHTLKEIENLRKDLSANENPLKQNNLMRELYTLIEQNQTDSFLRMENLLLKEEVNQARAERDEARHKYLEEKTEHAFILSLLGKMTNYQMGLKARL